MKKLILIIIFFISYGICSAQSTKPYQFIAKLYTEALGRIPDQGGWQSYQSQMPTITDPTFKQWMSNTGKAFYENNSEFSSRYSLSDNTNRAARLLALYRGALNREPDISGFNNYLSLISTTESSWNAVVNDFFSLLKSDGTASEFSLLIDLMITQVNSGKPYYGWGNTPIRTDLIPQTSDIYSESVLKADLGDNNPRILYLAQMAVISLGSQLVIPAGYTITTRGNPLPSSYAKMARIIRGSGYTISTQPLVVLMGNGATLENVWVDGQVEYLKTQLGDAVRNLGIINIKLDGGYNNLSVLNCRSSETCGFTNIGAFRNETSTSHPSTQSYISNNLITAYGSNHTMIETLPSGQKVQWWVDGISVSKDNTIINNNSIIDASDACIVLYYTNSFVSQNSQVYSNSILNAGNSAYVGLAADPLYVTSPPTIPYSFSGSSFNNNLLWTSPQAHMDLGIAVGTRVWFDIDKGNIGTGASFASNTTGSLTIRANMGILVNGMTNATISGSNLLSVNLVNTWGLPISSSFGYDNNSLPIYASFNGSIPSGFVGYSDTLLRKQDHGVSMRITMGAEHFAKQTEEIFADLSNYPNPFNPTTVISYQLPKDGIVTLKVYDILGNEITTLANGYKTVGKYSVSFDASRLASGIYFYQLISNGFVSTKKMLLLK